MRQVSDMRHFRRTSPRARHPWRGDRGLGLLAGCSSRDADLDRFIDADQAEPGGRVEPLPEVKPYDSFSYIERAALAVRAGGSGGARTTAHEPDHRNREFLEQFSLDTLKMVGTLNLRAASSMAWYRPRTDACTRGGGQSHGPE
jgi:Tfp pilus assembly protein PilP